MRECLRRPHSVLFNINCNFPNMKRILFFNFFIIFSFVLSAQAPTGYYANAVGKSGRELQDSLCSIIGNHRAVHWGNSYYDTITHITVQHDTCVTRMFLLTDPAPDNSIYDMYNGCTFLWEQTGSTSTVPCMGYEKEHVFASKWFNGRDDLLADSAYTVYRDLHHLYPADRVVNNAKSDKAYGIAGDYPWTQTFNIGAKIGVNEYVAPDASVEVPRIEVFEPADAYKGDFARSIFYIATRYMHEDATWRDDWENAPMNVRSQLRPWAFDLLLEWHFADPVSSKEMSRNNAIYGIQGNRNPFIDHPELVALIWGNDSAHFAFAETPAPAPHITRCEALNASVLEVEFSEPMAAGTLQDATHYHLWPDYPEVASIQLISSQVVRLTLESPLQNGKNYKCSFCHLENEDGSTYLRDTILNVRYGYAAETMLLAGWTFDQSYVLGRSIPAGASCDFAGVANLHFDGTHGSDDFAIANNDSLSLPTGDAAGNFCSSGASNSLQFKKTSALVANGNAFVIDCATTAEVNDIVLCFSARYTSSGFKKLTYEVGQNDEFSFVGEDSLPNYMPDSKWHWFQVDLSHAMSTEFTDHFQIRITLDGASGTGNIRFDNIFLLGKKCLETPVVYEDTVLCGQPYSGYGFELTALDNQQPGMNYHQRQTSNEGACDGLVALNLYVVPTTPTSVTETTEQPRFAIYPNPATTSVRVEGAGMKEVVLRNSIGQQMRKISVSGRSVEVPVSQYPSGLYIVTIITTDNKTIHQKLLVQ